MFDNSEDVPVTILEKEKGKKNVYVETGEKSEVSYNDIIGEADVSKVEVIGKKGRKKANYEIKNSSLTKLRTVTKNFISIFFD